MSGQNIVIWFDLSRFEKCAQFRPPSPSRDHEILSLRDLHRPSTEGAHVTSRQLQREDRGCGASKIEVTILSTGRGGEKNAKCRGFEQQFAELLNEKPNRQLYKP